MFVMWFVDDGIINLLSIGLETQIRGFSGLVRGFMFICQRLHAVDNLIWGRKDQSVWRRQGLCFGNFALLFVCEANGNFIQALASTDSRILRRGCKVLFRWKFCRREEQFIFKFWLFNSGETIEENLWNYTICLYLLVASVHHLIQEFFW